jgi:hypothetical protein
MLLNSNCESLSFKKDDELSLNREIFSGNQLRTDGYYFVSKDSLVGSVYFFYRNGILRETGSLLSLNDFERFELLITTLEFDLKGKENKDCWGVFNIQDNVIKFERWYGGQGAKPAYVSEGVILNDTTFHITKSYRSNGTELKERDETYHFKQFSPKPDSTNVFIK